MRYLKSLIPTTIGRLRDLIGTTILRAPDHFPDDYGHDLEGSYYSMEEGVENLRKKFGDAKADQILDMIRQAKAHHIADDNLGSRLLQDVEMVIANRQPYAYPPELYRWPLDPSLPELSNADLLNPED